MNTLNGHGKRRRPDPEPIAPPKPENPGAPGYDPDTFDR